MKKSLIASVLATMIFAPMAANAATILNQNGNTVDVTGKISVAAVKEGHSKAQMVNNSSKIGFNFGHDFGNGLQASAQMEWGVNGIGDKTHTGLEDGLYVEDAPVFSNHLANVSIHQDELGTLTVGKLWGAYYDVAANTDLGNYYGSTASGFDSLNDGGLSGTGRADNAIQYRNNFGDVNVALQMQLQDREIELGQDVKSGLTKLTYGNTVGGSVSYKATDNLTIAAAGNVGRYKANYTTTVTKSVTGKDGKVTSTQSHVNSDTHKYDSIYGASATWGNYGQDGLYAAVNVNKSRYHEQEKYTGQMLSNAVGVEAMVAYTQDNVTPYLMFNNTHASDMGEISHYRDQSFVAGVNYKLASHVNTWVEAKKDMSKVVVNNVKLDGDNGVAAGISVSF